MRSYCRAGPRDGGARLMVGFMGTEAPDSLRFVLEQTGARSVIVFARNLENAVQTKALIEEIRSLVPWPLLIAVDQEGGAVVRLSVGITVFPGNMALGAANDVELARRQGRESGRQLRALGFDFNLAPVIDLQTNPANPGIGTRSFGAEIECAVPLARALIEGHAESGILSCLKHFPGKGAAGVDAHLDLPVLEASLEEFRHPHLEAFSRLIRCVDPVAVMSTHLVVKGLDPDHPATLSPRVIGEILRGELGFRGVVVSDDLEMGAIVKNWGVPESALRAAQAGHDLIPVCHQLDRQLGAAERLSEALESGELDRDLHEQALARLDATIARCAGDGEGIDEVHGFDLEAGDRIAREIAERAVHVFSDARGLIPIGPTQRVHVIAARPQVIMAAEDEADRDWDGAVRRAFEAAGFQSIAVTVLDVSEARADVKKVLAAAASSERVVLLTWNVRGFTEMRRLLDGAMTTMVDRLIAAHLHNPFDQAFVKDGVSSLTAFGYRGCHLRALARVLAGQIEASGRMPAPIR